MGALTNRQRIQQVTTWLRERFPTPLPVEVVFRRFEGESGKGRDGEGTDAEITRRGRRLEIALEERLSRAYLLHALVHEWAHAVDWRHGELERLQDEGEEPLHPDTWGVTYARVYRAFYDEGGWEESRDFTHSTRKRSRQRAA